MGCCLSAQDKCSYVDAVHFATLERHYDNGLTRILWSHIGGTLSTATTNWGSFLNISPPPGWEGWIANYSVIGQHTCNRLSDIVEANEVNTDFDGDGEEDYTNDCNYLILYVSQYWQNASSTNPTIPSPPSLIAVLVRLRDGECLRMLWRKPMYLEENVSLGNTPLYSQYMPEPGDGCLDPPDPISNIASCVQAEISSYFNTNLLISSNKNWGTNACFMGGFVYNVRTDESGWLIQNRNIITGEIKSEALLGGVESLVHATYGPYVTIGAPIWAFPLGDENIMTCQGIPGNNPDEEAEPPIEEEPGGMKVVAWQLTDGSAKWSEVRRSAFHAHGGVPIPGDGVLLVSGYYPPEDPEDPESDYVYGIFACTYANLEDPPLLYENMIGTLSKWCDKVYSLGDHSGAPDGDPPNEAFGSKRTRQPPEEDDPVEILQGGFEENGYTGWDNGPIGFPEWGGYSQGWWTGGIGFGWPDWFGVWGWYSWWAYVVRDMTDGGDRESITTIGTGTDRVFENDCLANCEGNDEPPSPDEDCDCNDIEESGCIQGGFDASFNNYSYCPNWAAVADPVHECSEGHGGLVYCVNVVGTFHMTCCCDGGLDASVEFENSLGTALVGVYTDYEDDNAPESPFLAVCAEEGMQCCYALHRGYRLCLSAGGFVGTIAKIMCRVTVSTGDGCELVLEEELVFDLIDD